MRYACKLRGLPYQQFSLPAIKSNNNLPVMLNASVVKVLIKAFDLLAQASLTDCCKFMFAGS
jgi:hypothetical protein